MCVSPITIRVNNSDGFRTYQVPCGKCFECLKTKQNDYMVRIYEELLQVSKACFVTLTYKPKTVPTIVRDGKEYLTVWKPDVKNWIKRFRTNYERKTGVKGLRYFLCSEYGPKTHRPHYHAIFFGLSKKDMWLALDDWSTRFGYVCAKDVDYKSKSLLKAARYVSKYACKGVFENPFRCIAQPSEEFSTILKRFRQNLHIPYGCVPYVFTLSCFRNVSDGFSPERAVNLQGLLFRRGIKEEVCASWRL